MNNACFIVPYFGTFNSYFQLFLDSCSTNADYTWLIITDNDTHYDYPDNVIVLHRTFESLKASIENKLGFPVSLDRPYKLCDFKPAYGFIFEEYLRDYPFWGHCDTDLIWGDISSFISESDWQIYDKIGFLGHCTLYRNKPEINRVFMNSNRYRDVFQNPENCSFDEEFGDSINDIFIEHGYPIDLRQREANIFTKSSELRVTRWNFQLEKYQVERRGQRLFIWDNGSLIRYFMTDGCVKEKHYMYIHLQSRPMQVKVTNKSRYKIIPNAFEDVEAVKIDAQSFDRVKLKNFNIHYLRLRSKNLELKLRKRIGRR